MKLRWYQTDAVKAVYDHLEDHADNPCVVMPTGAGKSPTIAKIAHDVTKKWHGRCLIVAHRKELLQQNAEKLWAFDKDLDIGFYSAGLGRRDGANAVVIAGVQSIYNRAAMLGSFNIILVDEAHLIPFDGEGMYQTLIAGLREINPGVRVVGFTATPFRMKGGSIAKPDSILNTICYDTPVKGLIAQGFLTKLVSYAGTEEGKIDTVDVAVRGGEFVPGQIEMKALVKGRVACAVKDIIKKTEHRKKVLVFTCSVKHCQTVALELGIQCDEDVAMITGETPRDERDAVVEEFRAGGFKFLCNIQVFTEGLDVPDIDTIVLLRPTKSPGLYVQMVGRGFRMAPGKHDCLILDYGDNVIRHGPVDLVEGKEPSKRKGEAPAKECPECQTLIAASYSVCPDCGHEFPKPKEPPHNVTADSGAILGMDVKPEWERIDRITYEVHTKFDSKPGHPKTVRVNYHSGMCYTVSEWVCVEHEGFARQKAMKWWFKRQKLGQKIPCPVTASEAVEILESGRMRRTGRIFVKQGHGRRTYDQILDYELMMNDGKTLMSDLQAQVNKEPDDDDIEVPF